MFKHMQFILKITRLNSGHKLSGSITEQKSLGSDLIQNQKDNSNSPCVPIISILSENFINSKIFLNHLLSLSATFFSCWLMPYFYMVVN